MYSYSFFSIVSIIVFFSQTSRKKLRSCCSKCNRSASDRLALAATLSALPVAGHACAKWPSWGVAASLMNSWWTDDELMNWWTVRVWSFVFNNLSSLISSEYVRINFLSHIRDIQGQHGTTLSSRPFLKSKRTRWLHITPLGPVQSQKETLPAWSNRCVNHKYHK